MLSFLVESRKFLVDRRLVLYFMYKQNGGKLSRPITTESRIEAENLSRFSSSIFVKVGPSFKNSNTNSSINNQEKISFALATVLFLFGFIKIVLCKSKNSYESEKRNR